MITLISQYHITTILGISKRMGNKMQAIAYEEKVITILEKKLPHKYTYLIDSYRSLSSLYLSIGNKEKANDYAAKAENEIKSSSHL